MKNLGIIAVAALLVVGCSNKAKEEGSPQPSASARSSQQALLITDLTLDAGVIGNTVSYEATLPAASVVGTVSQTLEANWNATIHTLTAPPIVPQGWTTTYYAGATALGAAPTTPSGWSSVTRLTTTGAVTADGIDGERQALLSSIGAPPVVIPASFSGGSAGDGWDVFFDPAHTRVFNIHHHNGPATLMCRVLSNSTTCPGYPMALSNTPSRATGRVDELSMKIWVPTSNSGRLAWDCANINTGARCATPTVLSTYSQRDSGYDNHADPAIIGRKMYALGRTPTTSVITCLDMSTGTECTGATLPLNGQFNDAGLAAIGTRLYAMPGTGLGIDCYDSTTMMRCPGTWPVAAARSPVWAVPNADGSVSNFCSDAQCYAADGTTSTLPPNFRANLAANPVISLSYTGIQYGKATSFANKAAWVITGNRAQCWDMATDAACAPAFPISVTSMYAPTFDPEDSDCLWTNADTGVIQNWRVSTGAAGCSGGPPKISFKAAISIPRLGCDPSTRVWQYKSFKLVTPSPAQYTSAKLTVKNSFGADVAGWTNITIPAGTATVDLTNLPTALAGSTPTFEVATLGFTDTSITPAADFRVTTGATPQMCWSLAGPASSCPATAGLATINAGSTQVTPVTAKGAYTTAANVTTNYTDLVSQATVPDTTPYLGNCGSQLIVTAKQADSSLASGVQVFLLDNAGAAVTSGGNPVSATTDASGSASFGVWAGVGYKLKMNTMLKYSPASMTIISGGLGATTASGGVVTSNTVTPPLSSSATVFVSVNLLAPAPPVITAPAAAALTSVAPLLQGTCVTAATVSVFEGATQLCSAVCANSTFSCRSSTLAEGLHTVFATQSDVHGDSNASANRAFTVETVTLTVTPGTATYDALGAPVVLDPTLTVVGTGNVTGATVTIGLNFQSGDVLHFTNAGGITGSYDGTKGTLTLSGTATTAAYQVALSSVTFTNSLGAKPSGLTRTITFALGTAVSYQANSHFYEYVSGGSWTWSQAKTAAEGRLYFGMQGYLATIGSSDENAYVSAKLAGAGWLGASAIAGQGYPRVWSWATGPEAGTAICNNTGNGSCTSIAGAYSSWNGGEPNNSGNTEYRAQFLANGLWNDLPDSSVLPGYVVEYGGTAGEPALSITGSRFLAVRPAELVTVSPAAVNGTASCTSPVAFGGNSSCTFAPAVSYRLGAVTDNGVDVLASVSNGSYALTNLTADHTIAVTFTYVPPTIAVSAGAAVYDALSTPVALDPGVLVDGIAPISGATVTVGANFQVGDVLTFVAQAGITGSYDAAKGILTLTGSASPAAYQAALASVLYSNTLGAKPSTATRTITFALGTAVSYQSNSHFYEYISGGSWTFTQAQTAAAQRSYFGMQGYLATVTSASESAYVSSKLNGAGWMGASAPVGSGFGRVISWVTGPEAGTPICTNTSSVVCPVINGAYSNWAPNQPDNSGFEPRIQFVANGTWNDLPDNYPLPGYVVEYGGMAGDPALSITASRNLQVRAAALVTISPAATNGTASCVSPVIYGGNSTCTFAAAVSYRLGALTDNGVDVLADVANGQYQLTNLVGDHTIVVTFDYVPPTLTVTPGTAAYDALGAPVVLDPGLLVDGIAPITGATVTVGQGYQSGDVLTFQNQAGITGSYDAAKGIMTLTGSATPAAYQAALASITFSNTRGATPTTALRTITFALGTAVSYQSNSHFYEFVSGASLTWSQAKTAAEARRYFGMHGYLATIANGQENAYVSAKLNGAGWLGASALANSSYPRDWSWATGPEAGTPFCSNTFTGTCSSINGGYSNWNGGEPNNSGNEYRAQFLANGLWNDLSDTAVLPGYVVEYGGLVSDPPLLITGSRFLQVRAATAVVVSSSLNASQWAQTVHFTASYVPAASTGTVQFQVDGVDFGAPVSILAGVATSADVSTLTIGTHPVTAAYLGDVERQPISGSLAGGQGVTRAANGNGLCDVATQADVCVSNVCDPDGKCGYSNTVGPCTPVTASTVCRTGVCDPDGTCGFADGDGPCTAGTTTASCRSGICGAISGLCAPAVPAGCGDDRDCSAFQYCDGRTFTCAAKVPAGNQLPPDPRHNTGVCTVAVGAAVCVGGACEVGDDKCGITNTHACATNGNCRSGVCGADGKCGVANDGACTLATQCRSGVCDADGKCGAPNDGACTTGAACRSGICGADLKCGTPNGGICTDDAACRGGACAADGRCGTPNGGACTTGTSCRAGSCQSGTCSATCTSSSQCGAGLFCGAASTCVPKIPNGGSCNLASECASAICSSDGKCGANPGDVCSAPNDCRAGGCMNGTCGPDCSADAQCITGSYCSTAGTCVAANPNGTACTLAVQCTSGVCEADGQCGATDGRPCAGAADCRSGICSAANTCAATCATNADCVAGNFCDPAAHDCRPVAPNGGACADDSQCRSSVCDSDGTCGAANGRPCGQADNCRSGVCSTDGQCGTANGGACISPLTCRTGVCDADGKCGSPIGGACTTGAICRAGQCNPDGKCGAPNGDPCTAAADCRSGVCASDGVCGDDLGSNCVTPATCRTGACSGGQCSLGCQADAECASGTFCEAGFCRAGLPNGALCVRAVQCQAGVCSGDGRCGAPQGGACATPSQCRAGACAGGSCGPTCASNSECVASMFCSSGTCTPRLPNGDTCSAAFECASSFCVGGLCGVPTGQPCAAPAQCRSGICDDVSGSCAATCASNAQCATGSFCDATSHHCQVSAPNGAPPTQPCSSGSQCTSGVCASDGACGQPDGERCLTGAVCRGGACVNGLCDSGCTADAQCAGDAYCNAVGACTPKTATGGACTRAAACVSGTCASDGLCGTPTPGACTAPVQCRAGACSNGTCGTSCLNDGECLSGRYCGASGTCAPKLPAGTLCSSGSQCEAGVCAADGRCGKPAGDACAAASQCRSAICSAGSCASTCALDADCPAANFCDATSHSCLPQGGNGGGGARTCTVAADCASGVCAADGRCGYPTGGGSCNLVNASLVCRSGACSPSTGTCVPGGGRGCSGDVDCAALGGYCDSLTLTCTSTKLPAGAPLPRDPMHGGGTCTTALAQAVCLGGACDPADDRCGLPNSRPCVGDTQCRSGQCGTDGLCGAPNGGACVTAALCRSGACVDGECGQPNGAPCAAAGSCQSGVCTAGVCGVPSGGPCATDAACRAGQCGTDGFCGAPNGGACLGGDACRSGSCEAHVCVAGCTSNASCAQGLSCQAGTCAPALPNGAACTRATECASATCTQGTCGTPTGGACVNASACKSDTCSGGSCATGCSADGDCLSTSACVSGACTPKAPGGTSCTRDLECAGGQCVGGQCGQSAGGACSAPVQCQSNICDAHGTCSDTCAADGECRAGTYCGPAHTCVAVVSNGQPCTSGAQCTSGVCRPDGQCGFGDGEGACTAQTAATVCRSGACGTASLTCVPAGGLGCSVDADCDASTFCAPGTRTCVAKLAVGQPIPHDALHENGVCTPASGAATCVSGVCDAKDDLCGMPTNGVCTNHAQCRGGACGPDGRCGVLNGSDCTADTACRSGVCDADGKCGSLTGACEAAADCRSGLCSAADGRCGQPAGAPCASNDECRGAVCAADGRCGAATGESCTTGDGCRAGACVSGTCSTSCVSDGQCGAGRFCAGGTCTAQVTNGNTCARPTQCASGVCGSDGKCGGTTGTACTEAAQCRVACTAGACSTSCSSDGDCATGSCEAGSCTAPLANGDTCARDGQCAAGVCGADQKCGAQTGAACVTPGDCRSGICDAQGTCADTCATAAECAAGQYCDASTHGCKAVGANGAGCTSSAQCLSGVCGSNGQCGGAQGEACGLSSMCQSGVCDPVDQRCGLGNGSSGCTEDNAATVCRTGVCVAGTCGKPDGEACNNDLECASGSCSIGRTCAPAGTEPGLQLKGGTGCSSTGELGGFMVLAMAMLAMFRKRRVAARVATVGAALVASTSLAQTQLVQGFAAQNYDPSYAGDNFFAAPQATVKGHLLPAAKLTFNYGYNPVRIIGPNGQVIPQGTVIKDQLYFHVDLSLALLERLRIDVGLPVAAVQTGDPQSPGSPGVQGGRLGDMRVGLRGSLLGTAKDVFALGVQGDLVLPTGSPADFTGAGSTRGHLRVLASGAFAERFIYSAGLGVMIAPHQDVGLGDVGTSLTYSAGAAMLFADGAFQVGPELFGSTVFSRGASPLEVLLGARYRYKDLVFGAGLGTSLTGAPSAAVVRGLVNIAWEPQPAPPPAPVVACVTAAPVDASASRDRDADGVADLQDACQFDVGVKNADPAKNGCPADEDLDGIADAADQCPGDPGLRAHNGCPPPADQDGDGILDAEDVCPTVAGLPDGEKKGCPLVTAELKVAHIELAERVRFAHNKTELEPESESVLRSVAKVMTDHPELLKVSIEGFTDDRGHPAYNVQLSADRAAAVLEWLVKNGGIDRKRLTSAGHGSEQPIAANDTEAGRKANRRTEVRVIEYRAQ